MRKKLVILAVLVLVGGVAAFTLLMHKSRQSIQFAQPKSPYKNGEHGSQASAPYPYKSMLAICSDIDGSTYREFEIYHKFMNTDAETGWGKGLSLDVGDSFWMYSNNDNDEVCDGEGSKQPFIMTYFTMENDYHYSAGIEKYFKAGWIDSIHSYGDFSRVDDTKPVYKPENGEHAAEEMAKIGLLPTVWINHGNAANVDNLRNPNFKDAALNYQQGAKPDSKYYHADKTIANGIKFVWFSNPSGIFSIPSPLYPVTLEDGQKVWGFIRYTGEDEKLSHRYNWNTYELPEQLSKEHLDRLAETGGVAVVGQHLGGAKEQFPLTEGAANALRTLSEYEKNGDILVARTSRLLEFVRVRDNLIYTYEEEDGVEKINITLIADDVLGEQTPTADDLKGITFNVKDAASAKIFINGAEEKDLVKSDAGEAQKIGFKWYQKDSVDYTAID